MTETDFFLSDTLDITGDLFLTEDISIGEGSGTDDDTIFFDEEVAPQTLKWDNTNDEFAFSNDLDITGGLVVSGATDLDGSLLDTADSSGTNGQVLSSTGTAVQWSNAGTGTVTSVATGNGLTGGTITTTGTLTIDAAIVPQLAANPNVFTGEMDVQGDLDLSGAATNDDDSILFDDGTKSLIWDESIDSFAFSNDLTVNTDLFADGDFFVGITSDADDDTIFFDDGTTEFLRWDDSETEFAFSSDLFVAGTLFAEAASDTAISADRTGTDGVVVEIERNGVTKGTISVSGETVSYNPFTGSHYAWTDEEISTGTLVSLTGNNKYHHDNPESEILYGVTQSSMKNDPAILGAYLALQEPSLVSGPENPHLIMAVGNGDVWIADMGDDIKPGDLLISSDVPGHAMKDDRTAELSYIIGRAAESVVWSEVEDTKDGVKHKKISILFNFVPLNNN